MCFWHRRCSAIRISCCLMNQTNHLDIASINWLEEISWQILKIRLLSYHMTVISLNQVCTLSLMSILGAIQLYVGNYDFWLKSSELALQLSKDANKKRRKNKRSTDLYPAFQVPMPPSPNRQLRARRCLIKSAWMTSNHLRAVIHYDCV